MIKDRLRKLAHPDAGKHKKKVQLAVDPFWQGKEQVAR